MGIIRWSGIFVAAAGLMHHAVNAMAAENFSAPPGYSIIAPELSVETEDGVVVACSQTTEAHFLFHVPGLFSIQPVAGDPVACWAAGQPFRCERSSAAAASGASSTRLTIYADGFPMVNQPLPRHTYLRVIIERQWSENGTQRTSKRTEYHPIDVRTGL